MLGGACAWHNWIMKEGVRMAAEGFACTLHLPVVRGKGLSDTVSGQLVCSFREQLRCKTKQNISVLVSCQKAKQKLWGGSLLQPCS